MGDISEKWLSEIRSLAKDKAKEDIEAKKVGDILDNDAQCDFNKSVELGEGRVQNVPMARSTSKLGSDTECVIN